MNKERKRRYLGPNVRNNVSDARVILYTRPDCLHCSMVRSVIDSVCARLEISWAERNVDRDSELQARFGLQIPVVELDGQVIAREHLDIDNFIDRLR